MARNEHTREDLLNQATAYRRRLELSVPDSSTVYFLGLKDDGSGSIYVDDDPVFQFNAMGQIRRGFWEGNLLKSERGKLILMSRVRTAKQVQLLTRPLAENEADTFLSALAQHRQRIADALTTHTAVIRGQFPKDDLGVLDEVATWLGTLPATIAIASRPSVD